MSSIGTGYDLSATTFSPDGRVFQVEYANKAVDNSGTALALRCKDGVVFAVEKLISSKLWEPTTCRRIFTVDRHIGVAVAGLLADSRVIVDQARGEAAKYRSDYDRAQPVDVLQQRLAGFVQVYTLYSHVRPFGSAVLIGSWSEVDGSLLYMIEPSGISCGYHGCAIGKGRQAAKTELEKLDYANLTVAEGIKEAARVIYSVHDEVKDKEFVLELSWVGAASKGEHKLVPQDVYDAAVAHAKAAQEEDESDDE